MNPRVYELWHERYDERGQDHDKLLGTYSTRDKVEEALALLGDKPGFRDYPDGFQIVDGPLDETYWLEGFVTVWGDEEPDELPADPSLQPRGKRMFFPSVNPLPRTYWALWHRYVDEWDCDHEIIIGTYTSRENAERGIDLVRHQLGFRDHPDGFEITQGVIDQTDMSDGFATVRNGRERDEPIRNPASAR